MELKGDLDLDLEPANAASPAPADAASPAPGTAASPALGAAPVPAPADATALLSEPALQHDANRCSPIGKPVATQLLFPVLREPVLFIHLYALPAELYLSVFEHDYTVLVQSARCILQSPFLRC